MIPSENCSVPNVVFYSKFLKFLYKEIIIQRFLLVGNFTRIFSSLLLTKLDNGSMSKKPMQKL